MQISDKYTQYEKMSREITEQLFQLDQLDQLDESLEKQYESLEKQYNSIQFIDYHRTSLYQWIIDILLGDIC
jgi:DNA repair exonuclease SbcCD ATPase subunit